MPMDSWNERQVRLEQMVPLIREQLAMGKRVKFAPRGTSMLPMLRQGIDSVILSPLPEKLKKYDVPLYQRDNGQFVLHRIVKTVGTYTCMGDNQFVPEQGLRHDQMIAVVTAFCRGDREIPVTAISYRVYCRLWHYSRPIRHLLRRGLGWLRRHIQHKA